MLNPTSVEVKFGWLDVVVVVVTVQSLYKSSKTKMTKIQSKKRSDLNLNR